MFIIMKKKWTKEGCAEESKKYKTRTEWKKKSSGSYRVAYKNGWLGELCSHMDTVGNKYKRMVYCYVFPDKSVYVGLTYNENLRCKQHKKNKDSGVKKYMDMTNLTPEYIKICDYIPVKEAQEIEMLTIENYKNNGYNILNITKGGEIGCSQIIWTKEKCMEEAKKCKTMGEWRARPNGSYYAAYVNGWFEFVDHLLVKTIHPPDYWTKERCIEKAKEYKTRTQWNKESKSSYLAALRNGWMEECCKHMNTKKPTLKIIGQKKDVLKRLKNILI